MKYWCAEKAFGASHPGARLDSVTLCRLYLPALRPVVELRDHDLVQDLLMGGRIFDRPSASTPIQVARHPVGRRDEHAALGCGIACRCRNGDAAMLQEAADDDFTRMFSDRPGTPGLRQQIPRTTSSIGTPALDAGKARR